MQLSNFVFTDSIDSGNGTMTRNPLRPQTRSLPVSNAGAIVAGERERKNAENSSSDDSGKFLFNIRIL